MDKVKMVALGTFHATSVRAEPLHDGDEFEIAEAEAKELEDRGLAKLRGAAKFEPRRRPTAKRAG